jgi:phosphoglycerate dehydrogenase-like enzyme
MKRAQAPTASASPNWRWRKLLSLARKLPAADASMKQASGTRRASWVKKSAARVLGLAGLGRNRPGSGAPRARRSK